MISLNYPNRKITDGKFSLTSKRLLPALAAISLISVSPVAFADEFDLTVNGVKVPRAQMELMLNENKAQVQPGTNLKEIIRDSMVRREVLAQQALKDKIDQDPVVKTQVDMVIRNTIAAAYMDRALQKSVTDKEVKDEFDRAIKEFGNAQEYLTKHILVRDEAKAKKISAALKANPKNFEDTAKKESEDPGSATRGGELGWVTPGTMVPEFENGMIATAPGKVSDPIKSQFGFHIIKVEQTRKAKAPAFEEVKDRIRDQLARERAEKIITDLVGKATIK